MAWLTAKANGRQSRLQTASLMAGLNARELRILERLLQVRRFIAGEIVFDAGDEGQAIYFVLAGEVAICRPGQGEAPIAVLGPGSHFGEMALLEDRPRSAQARVLADAELGVLYRGDFLGLLDTHAVIASKIALQLARQYSVRLREMSGLAPGSAR